MKRVFYCLSVCFCLFFGIAFSDIPLYWWRVNEWTKFESTNFGDELSAAIIERIVGRRIQRAHHRNFKLLGLGSIIQFGNTGDVVWGAGMNGNDLNRKSYSFKDLDVRAVRGPLTQKFLMDLGIKVPSVFGDPALLLPRFFPEFQVASSPKYEYIVIPHIGEIRHFSNVKNVVLPTAHWKEIVKKITQSQFVISSSLHGIVVAEAFGIPARFIRVTYNEPDFKYLDYYLGTGRETMTPARSIEEALEMGGEPPPICDLDDLLRAFPFEYFQD